MADFKPRPPPPLRAAQRGTGSMRVIERAGVQLTRGGGWDQGDGSGGDTWSDLGYVWDWMRDKGWILSLRSENLKRWLTDSKKFIWEGKFI